MEIQNRITYDPDELIRLMESELDRLKVFRFDNKYRELLGEPFIRILTGWEQDIRSRRNDPFTLVVCGEFKRGKSSLINALLGEEVVPTNVTTETVTLNRIAYGAHSNEALLSGGRRMRLTDQEMERENLERIMKQSAEPFQQIEIRRPIELLKYVTVIDTPGLADALSDFSELAEKALSQADAVIYVFSVSYPLAQSEQLFLKTAVLPQNYTELVLAGNYTDLLSGEQDYDRVLQMLKTRIRGLLPDCEPCLVSALDESCRLRGEERPNPAMQRRLEENFDAFRAKIEKLIKEKRELVLPDRMQRLVRGMAAELKEYLDALSKGLEMSSKDIKASVQAVNSRNAQLLEIQEENGRKIDSLISQMQTQTWEWMEELLDQMQEEVQRIADVPADDLTKYYSFYCIDLLQEAMNRCLDYHTLLLYDELEAISEELTVLLSGYKPDPACGFRFVMDNKTWTKGDNVSFVVSKFQSFGFLSLVADGVAGAMRQKEMAGRNRDILRMIGAQYSGLRVSAGQAIEGTYRKMAETVKKQLAEYYRGRIEAAGEQAEQAAAVARQDDEKKADIRNAIGQIRTILKEMEQMTGAEG